MPRLTDQRPQPQCNCLENNGAVGSASGQAADLSQLNKLCRRLKHQKQYPVGQSPIQLIGKDKLTAAVGNTSNPEDDRTRIFGGEGVLWRKY